jgi:predicted dehydrogenase
MKQRHFLIVGTGSVGKRHARNLHGLGCAVSTMDPRSDRREELRGELPLGGAYASLEEAMGAARFDGLVICSPPSFHVEQAMAGLRAGLPVLLEKPVAPTFANALKLAVAQRESRAPLLLGYTWRWWPPMAVVRQHLADGKLGALRHVRFIMSAHLADWHPWENYQDFFMSDQSLGGGALLDESHWIDLMLWFFGEPESVSAKVEKISDLEISSDDNVDMILSYPSGLRVSMHLDLYGRPHEKSIRFIGEKGSMLWTDNPNRVALSEGQDWVNADFQFERNHMFTAVAKEFLEICDGVRTPGCSLEDGLRALRVVEAARLSQRLGRTVSLSEVTG